MNLLVRDHLVSMIAPLIVWAVHFVASYVLVATVCARGWTHQRLVGWDPAELGVALISLAGLALIAYTALLNWRKYRGRTDDGQSGFFALTALLLCGMSAIALVWVAFPVLLLPTCAG